MNKPLLHYSISTPSNIALIKYWGKSSAQIPRNASLSLTLDQARTHWSCSFYKKELCSHFQEWEKEFFFEDQPHQRFEKKIFHQMDFFYESLRSQPYFTQIQSFLQHTKCVIKSSNSFHHSAGIASSASSMAGLALCLKMLEEHFSFSHQAFLPFKSGLLSEQHRSSAWISQISSLARHFSGSASRSLEGPLVLWGKHDHEIKSSWEWGTPLTLSPGPLVHLKNAILVVSSKEKPYSSSAGHRLMDEHPWAAARYEHAQSHLSDLLRSFQEQDEKRWINIIEREAMMLHALMMSSQPSIYYLMPQTWNIIHTLQHWREQSGACLAYTLDAGPNVHLLYPERDAHLVEPFINNELKHYCEQEMILWDRQGMGAIIHDYQWEGKVL
jgi:diphosphomevalonate decarboxylase